MSLLTLSMREPHLCLCKKGWIQGQPPSYSVAGQRSNLFATQTIIFHKKNQNLKVLKSRGKYSLFLEKLPSIQRVKGWVGIIEVCIDRQFITDREYRDLVSIEVSPYIIAPINFRFFTLISNIMYRVTCTENKQEAVSMTS